MTPIELLRWQLGLAWSLAELRLAGLTDGAEIGQLRDLYELLNPGPGR